MPENEATLLPEPFSEKNIDGSPISKTEEGKSLFRNPGRKDRRVADRRSGDRRSGEDRRIPNEYGYVPERTGPTGYNVTEPQRPEPKRPEPKRPEPAGYDIPETSKPEPVDYARPEPDIPESGGYGIPESKRPEPMEYSGPEPERTGPVDYAMPEPERSEPAVYDAPVYNEPEVPEADTYSYGSSVSFDEDRFEPPVDEKPGMIPNPMKMPPVKKKTGLDYDLDSDYGDYGTENDPGTDSGFGYSSYDETERPSSDDYGYGDDTGADDGIKEAVSGRSEEDPDYGSYDDRDTGEPSSFGTDDDDSGDGDDYGGYGSTDDLDYDIDYGSGSDIASDYY